MLKKWWSALLDLIYPPKCPNCRVAVDANGVWCSVCHSNILSVHEVAMHEHQVSALDSCIAICEYTGGVKRLLHDMKFRGAKRYGAHLQWLLEQSGVDKKLPPFTIILPVPLHPKRLAQRGYNQTECIFNVWAEKHQFQWRSDLLLRTKDTAPQWQLTQKERKLNMKEAFSITKPDVIVGKRFLLVDDIFTTGSTMDMCSKVLKNAGAIKVYGLVLASKAK